MDVVCDGEQGKPGFFTYVSERLAGFERRENAPNAGPWTESREFLAFSEFYQWYASGQSGRVAAPFNLVCTGPVTYQGQEMLQRDIANLKEATEGLDVAEVFMPSSSPTNIEGPRRNAYYGSQEEYLYALADAM